MRLSGRINETGYCNGGLKVITPPEERISGKVNKVTLTDDEWNRYRNVKPNTERVAIPFEMQGRKPKQLNGGTK